MKLVGQKVVAVRRATDKDMEDNGFDPLDYRRPCVIVLEDGIVLMPSRDDEGNGPGTFFINTPDGKSYYPEEEA